MSVLGSSYFSPNKCPTDTPLAEFDGCVGQFSSMHPDGINACLVDGAVRFSSDQIDSADEASLDALADIKSPGDTFGVWQSICVINDGNVLGDW